MSEFSYLDNIPARTDTEHYRDILREGLKRKLSYVAEDFEAAQDYGRRLMQDGGDITEELRELEATANGLLLAVLMLKRENERRKKRRKTSQEQFWQAAE